MLHHCYCVINVVDASSSLSLHGCCISVLVVILERVEVLLISNAKLRIVKSQTMMSWDQH